MRVYFPPQRSQDSRLAANGQFRTPELRPAESAVAGTAVASPIHEFRTLSPKFEWFDDTTGDKRASNGSGRRQIDVDIWSAASVRGHCAQALLANDPRTVGRMCSQAGNRLQNGYNPLKPATICLLRN
jgi:hypothetical protein